jgi:hypothetical protein
LRTAPNAVKIRGMSRSGVELPIAIMLACVFVACGGDSGEGPGASSGGAGAAASGGAGAGAGGSAMVGPCIKGAITLTGTADGAAVDIQSPIDGHLILQAGDPKEYTIGFEDGGLGMLWSGSSAGTGDLLDVVGTVSWDGGPINGGPRFCLTGTFQRIDGDFDEIRITGLSEFVDVAGFKEPPICGDPVPGTLDVCADANAP